MKQGSKLALVCVGLLAVLWLAVAPASAQDEEGFQVSAKSFVLMDAKTGQILLSLNPQMFIPPASTMKVMTALSVVQHLKMDDTVPVSAYAAAAPASKVGIKAG
ncbi:MAG: D-alanyl-D-alanine carboxypeptidase, partial [Desulfobaccales bacterium]